MPRRIRPKGRAQWQQPVETEDESDIIDEWANHLRPKGWRVGRWRQTHPARDNVERLADFENDEELQGTLLLLAHAATWNLYFYKDSFLT